MTKFANPTFCSPANNENYDNNYNDTFGTKCNKMPCLGTPLEGYTMCRRHLEQEGIVEPENPETD